MIYFLTGEYLSPAEVSAWVLFRPQLEAVLILPEPAFS